MNKRGPPRPRDVTPNIGHAMDLSSAAFWAALGSIILANIVLSGDNAVVIALAARSLPPHQQKQAIFWGSAAAIVMRIVLTLLAVEMLKWPWLKIIGGLLLLYIGVSLLNEDDGGPLPIDARPGLEALGIRCVDEIEQLGAALA